jgi:uncharacterized membrane protein
MLYLVLIGISTGMRTMTATAVLCWFAYLQLVPQRGWTAWTGMLVSVIIFTVFALGEYVGDTLPQTPNRTAPGPLMARLVCGAFAGILVARGTLEPDAGGVVFGVVGVLIGAYVGVRLRLFVAKKIGRDLPVAICESLVALGLAVFSAYKVHTFAAVMGIAPVKWMAFWGS